MTEIGLRIGDIKGASGSSYVEMNGTKLFAAVYGPMEPEVSQDSNTGIVQCFIEDAWDSSVNLKGLQHKLLHTFSATIFRDSYFKTLIRIEITIVSSGFSLSDAATLAGSLALLDAGIEMNDFVVSCTVGYQDGEFKPFTQSSYNVRVALMPSKNGIIETEVIGHFDGQAENNDFHHSAIEKAIVGCKELHQTVRNFLSSQLPK